MFDAKTTPPFPSASVFTLIIILSVETIYAQKMEPRWGHAATYIPSPPSLLIQGGKTDPSSSYTYTSSPNSPDTIIVPLDKEFTGSSPSFKLVSSDSSPFNAFHTFSTFGGQDSKWDIFSFGGDGGTLEPTQTQADSVWRGVFDMSNTSAEWIQEPNAWGNQPQRRLYHSAAGPDKDGKVYITGGLKGDGSGATYSDVYAYDIVQQSFISLPNLPQGTFGHSSVLLPNGTLVLLGGLSTSAQTGNPTAVPLSSAYTLDTTQPDGTWNTRSTSGGNPSGRRGASLVLTSDGGKAFLFGGGDAGLGAAYGDAWELDMGSSTWRQVFDGSGGPGARYGHTAVNVGRDQVLIFGGYGDSGPADADLHVWDGQTEAWVPMFIPPSSDPASPGTSSTALPDEPQISGQPTAETKEGDKQQEESSHTGLSGSRTQTETSMPTSSVSGTLAPDTSKPSAMSTGAKMALILGAIAIASVVVIGLLYRYRRKRRRTALFGRDWDDRGPGGQRPYGSREKGGEGLMDESLGQGGQSEKSPMVGLGMGVIGTTLASISSKFGRKNVEDPYVELADEQPELGGPMRRSTRRIGSGIRLVGPRPSPSSRYVPVRLSDAIGRNRPSLDPVTESRMDMLHDEDSRRFSAKERPGDWIMSASADEGRWTSASDILGHEREDSDPFSDGDDDSLVPPIRGGPVPTPHASSTNLDPFEDYHRPSSTRLSTYDDLLSPPTGSFDGSSLPRSQYSGLTGSLADAEEASIRQAHLASHTSPSILSPVESAYVPIKRSESFFKRMAAGGITSLLSRHSSQKGTVRVLDIRDPTPAPALWPIDSHDELHSPLSPAGPSYPPTAFKAGLIAPSASHSKGPSLSSLQSAKSMRDMVIVQREPTSSSAGECFIESTSPEPSATPAMSDDGDRDSRIESKVTAAESTTTIYAHTRHGLTTVSESSQSILTTDVGGGTPGSIVFNGADFTSPPIDMPLGAGNIILPSSAKARVVSTPPKLRPIPQKETPRPVSPGLSALVTPGKTPSEPPSGSPVPSPLVSHRRAVKDVVNSINKRGGGIPLAFNSPASQYSPATTAPPTPIHKQGNRPLTMYEAVKRERLLVANPDGRRDVNRSNSS